MSIAVRVTGYDAPGTQWSEMTRSKELSTGGAAFDLKHPVGLGQALQLALPLPKHFRQYDLTDASYVTYAIVRDVAPSGDGQRVGVMFYGKHPPEGYEKGVRQLLPTDQVAQRRHPRYDLTLNVRLRRLDGGPGPKEEWTVTENLSLGGALVRTGLPVMKGDTIGFETADGLLKTRAAVRNLAIGKDNVPRLAMMFVDPTAADGAREVLKRNGVAQAESSPTPAAPPATAAPAAAASGVRFQRRETLSECGAGKHGVCPGWGWEAVPRLLRLCRCTCHDG